MRISRAATSASKTAQLSRENRRVVAGVDINICSGKIVEAMRIADL
jgi:hypothetical protein